VKADYVAHGFSEHAVAEFDTDVTIDAISGALAALGHEVVRIGHVKALAARLVAGERWDLVFNIAEGVAGFGRESQVPALLEAFGVPYTFSDPLVCALTLHKGMAKQVARGHGVPTPDFALVTTPAEAAAVALPFPLFVKPVAEGTSKGVTARSLVRSRAALIDVCTDLLAEYREPVLVEEFLSGREFTVGILGTGADARALATLEVVLRAGADAAVYSYRNKAQWRELVEYKLLDAGALRRRGGRARDLEVPGLPRRGARRRAARCGRQPANARGESARRADTGALRSADHGGARGSGLRDADRRDPALHDDAARRGGRAR